MNHFKSITDTRLVIDVVAPGYAKEDIKVSKAVTNGGRKFVLTVKGKYNRPTGATGKLVPRLAFDKVIDEKFKETFELPLEDDYDLDGIAWDVRNGIIRVSVPKTALATGKDVAATEGNVNALSGADAADEE
jgi:HSP20 family molecular chaperone IbpA